MNDYDAARRPSEDTLLATFTAVDRDDAVRTAHRIAAEFWPGCAPHEFEVELDATRHSLSTPVREVKSWFEVDATIRRS